ncbi:MAG: hypothetical protein WCB12_21100 [Bryobacteraceae bacterium]
MAAKTRTHDRHHIPAPVTGTTQLTPNGAIILADKAFLDGFKERIHELFLTLGGLPGHVVQVQQEMNRLNNSGLADDRKTLIGDDAFAQITKAAEYAAFNFPQQTFTLASVGRTYYIERTNGKLIAYKT